jgi:hypothetical protein
VSFGWGVINRHLAGASFGVIKKQAMMCEAQLKTKCNDGHGPNDIL